MSIASRTTTATFKISPTTRRKAAPEPVGRVPRVARLMALAIRFDGLLRSGAVRNQAELAAVGHVTRARVTQILNLLHMAPDIQEQLLHLPAVRRGRDPISEGMLRPIAARVSWAEQRLAWLTLIESVHT